MLKILSVRRRRGAQRLPFVGLARICMIQKQKSCPRAVQRSGLYGDVVPNTGCCCALRGEVAKKRYKNWETKENICKAANPCCLVVSQEQLHAQIVNFVVQVSN